MAGALLAIGLLVQIEALHYFSFRDARPSIVLVVVVWYASRAELRSAAIFGLIAGLCEDALGATGAAWTISTMLAAAFASTLSRWFFADSIPVAAGVVFAATLLRRLVFWIVMALQGYPAGYARLHFHQALWTALLNALLVCAAMAVARRFQARVPA